MEKVLKFMEKIITVVKNWIIANGVEGVLGLVIGLILWVMGLKIYAGFALGVFATRNWDILKSWLLEVTTKKELVSEKIVKKSKKTIKRKSGSSKSTFTKSGSSKSTLKRKPRKSKK